MRRRELRAAAAAVALVGASLVPGCASAPAQLAHRGQLLPAIDGVKMSCAKPHALTRNCSGISGAKLVVLHDGVQFKVAGSADGRIVLAMPDKLVPSQADCERVYDRMRSLAAASGAQVVEVEAVAAGRNLMGFVFHFDRDQYAALQAKALVD